ncbi:Sec-independent protein translocase subunit TatA [Arthrobacter agilis]|uniref:Sec-independent protein translocase subunit TatA n=1 Tax=Arthrobacter agilis TaxID=37921 RepID=UPI0027883609|nr:Sec-independent protein translocase subunit TatA [Arthrobacter agilis]MDQ0734840.1 TatA/E family protein of Tat protein translocase [Arthrobacter agilis]
MRLEGWHIVIIIVLAIVLFGAPKLPGLARSVGQSLRIFKSEVKQMKDENNTPDAGTDPVEGRVVSNPSPQTYTPTYQTPVQHPGQPGQQYGQQAPHHAAEGRTEGTQAGPSQQGSSPAAGQ